METFIVRIYRGIPASLQEPAGTVERVGSADRVGFSGTDQLLRCLLAPERCAGTQPRSSRGADDTAKPGEST
jgi:hypothetical protein